MNTVMNAVQYFSYHLKMLAVCSTPPSFDKAIYVGPWKSSYNSREKVNYRCEQYYQMEGPDTIQCLKGRWIGRPTCRGTWMKFQNAFIERS